MDQNQLFLLIFLEIIFISLFINGIFNVEGIIGPSNTDEKNISLLIKLAKSSIHTDNYDKALAALDIASTIANNSEVLYLKAKIFEKTGNLQQANSTYYEAYLNSPQNNTINFALSKLLFKLKEYDSSIQFIDRALKYDPTNSTLYYEKGKIFLGYKNYRDAIKEFDKAAIINNKTIYYLTKADSFFNLTHYTDALNTYRNITTFLDTHNVAAYLGEAEAYFKLKQYEEALNSYLDVINIVPNLNKTLISKAQKLNQLQEFELSKKYLNYAIKIYPFSSDAYVFLGNAFFNLKNHTDALNTFRNITTFLDTNNVAAYLGAANSLFELERYDEALEDYVKTIKLGNISNPSIILLPKIENLIKQKQFELAKKYLNNIISLSGKYKDLVRIYLLMGSISFDDKNYTDALNAYRNITTFLDTNNVAAYLGAANSLFELKNYNDVLIMYDKMYDLGIDPIQFYNNIINQAYKLYNLNNSQIALNYLDKSGLFNSTDSNAYFIKGKVLFKLKELKESQNAYKDALSFDPNNSTLFLNLGKAYVEDKLYKKAMSAYKKAISNNPSTQEKNDILSAIKMIENLI